MSSRVATGDPAGTRPEQPTRAAAATADDEGSRGLRAFRYRNFRLFAAGQLISLIGTWMQQVAQAWLVLQLTGDALTLGLLAAAQFLPVVVLGLFGGVVADNLPKRATLIVTQVGAMILAFVLFGLTVSGRIEVPQIFVLAVLLGLTNALEMPTRQAYLVDLVDRADLRNAIALNAAMFHGARIVGPAIAGLTIGLVGVAAAFFVNGLSFLAVIVSLLLIRVASPSSSSQPVRPHGVSGVLASLAEGLHYVRGTPIVLLSVVVVGLVATFAMNFQVLGPVLAADVLDSGATGFGFLMAAVGAGALAAALAVAFTPRPEPRVIGIGAVALGLASIVLAISRSYPLSLMAMFVAGGGAIGMAVTANATIQMVVPDALRGRVMAVYVTVLSASVPLGGLLMGGIASVGGAPLAFGVGGIVALAIGVVAWVRLSALLGDRTSRPVVARPAEPTRTSESR